MSFALLERPLYLSLKYKEILLAAISTFYLAISIITLLVSEGKSLYSSVASFPWTIIGRIISNALSTVLNKSHISPLEVYVPLASLFRTRSFVWFFVIIWFSI